MIWILDLFRLRYLGNTIFFIAELALIYTLIHTFVFAIISGRPLRRFIANPKKAIDRKDWIRIYRQNWRFLLLLDILKAFGVFIPIYILFTIAYDFVKSFDAIAMAGGILDFNLAVGGILEVSSVVTHRLAATFIVWSLFFVFRFMFRKRIRNLRLRFPGIKLYGLH